MGTQGDEIPTNIVTQSEDLASVQPITFKQTFNARDVQYISPEEPFNEYSTKLKFHIKPKVERVFKPTEVLLHVPLTIEPVKNDKQYDSPFFAGIDLEDDKLKAKDTYHARFRNPAFVHFIKSVKVKPNRQSDIEDQDSEKLQLVEYLRYFLQNTKEEKKNIEMSMDQGAFKKLLQSSNPDRCGTDRTELGRKPEQGQYYSDDIRESVMLENMTWLKYHVFKFSIPSAFFEMDTHIPGMYEFMIEIELEDPLNCILVKKNSKNGNDDNAVPAYYNARWRMRKEDVKLVIPYHELFETEREGFKNSFYLYKEKKMECYHSLNFVKSLPKRQVTDGMMTIRTEWADLNGVIPQKFFLMLVPSRDFDSEGLTQQDTRYGSFPFNVTKVDIKINNRSIFTQAIDFQPTTMEKQLKFFRYLSDCTAGEFDYEKRNCPFTDNNPYFLKFGKWIMYMDLQKEAGGSFADLARRINGELTVELTTSSSIVKSVTNPDVPFKCCIVFSSMPLMTLQDGLANKWAPVTTYATPFILPDMYTKSVRDGEHN